MDGISERSVGRVATSTHRLRGWIPLPRRWARARAWWGRQGLGRLNVAELKLILESERAGRG